MYLLDTDICVFVLRGPPERLRRKLLEAPIDEQAISAITWAELAFGVRLSSKPKQNQAALAAFARHLSILPWPAQAAEHYADIRARLQREGRMIGANDLLIAAQARSIGATVVTNNERDFKRIPRLTVENWL